MSASDKDEKPERLTDEEHHARAMLMGMRYHDGNGFPFYYMDDDSGMPDVTSFLDVETLEPIIPHQRGMAARAIQLDISVDPFRPPHRRKYRR